MLRERRHRERAAEEPTVVHEKAGRSMDPVLRALLEPRLGHSVADIRVHDDADSHALADSHDARAVTVGRHIALHAAAPALETPAGLALLAHEATHVAQQELAPADTSQSGGAEVIASPRHELEAHQVAARVLGGPVDAPPATVTAAPVAGAIQCWPWDDDSKGSSGGSLLGAVTSVGSSLLDAGASVAGTVYDANKQTYDMVSKGWNAITPDLHGANKLYGSYVDEQVKASKALGDFAVNATSDIPILGSVVKAGAVGMSGVEQGLAGLRKGGMDVATGTLNGVLHPVDAVTGLVGMAEHVPGPAGTMLKGAHGLYDIATGNEKGEYGKNTSELWANLTDGDKQSEKDLEYWAQLGGGTKAWEEKPIEAGARTVANILPWILGARGMIKGSGKPPSAPVVEPPGSQPRLPPGTDPATAPTLPAEPGYPTVPRIPKFQPLPEFPPEVMPLPPDTEPMPLPPDMETPSTRPTIDDPVPTKTDPPGPAPDREPNGPAPDTERVPQLPPEAPSGPKTIPGLGPAETPYYPFEWPEMPESRRSGPMPNEPQPPSGNKTPAGDVELHRRIVEREQARNRNAAEWTEREAARESAARQRQTEYERFHGRRLGELPPAPELPRWMRR
jgi:hypothetical protein